MKHTLLITASVAALLAGLGLASAQGVSEHREAPAATAQEQKAPDAHTDRQKAAAPLKSDQTKPGPTAQAPDKAAGPNHQTLGRGTSPGALPNATAHEASKSGAVMPLSTEQHAKIRDSLRGEKAERLANVQFSISIGDAIPGTVQMHRLPARVVEYAPQYRDYEYILVGDDILIVDPRTHRIVAVIAA